MNTPLWFKDAVVYQLHVKTFQDSDGDGVGDFVGLRQRLEYLVDLGVTALWLLPFYPSPLRDDGYDIADYFAVHPKYGTIEDFRAFLDEAHARGLRVITELVLNHTSDQNAWFQRARRAPPGSPERDFYVWSDDPTRYKEARIIFQDFESSNWTWDPIAKAYYWHRFYSHQPDLNFENPAVAEELLRAIDFWFNMGVDGMRLDAVPYLYEREGTNCENLPETHAFLRRLRQHLDEKFPGSMLLAEANQWPEDAVAYFGKGDECHMAFHFPLMPRLFMAIQMEDRFPIVDILDQTPAIPENCQWAIFLRNHDELTLEMVTDEERDYMVRVYAQDPRARINLGIRRRLAPLLGNNRRKMELIISLLFSMPGTPILYYGDEIGMGDNFHLGDRDGVRTPMQWSAERNAGFSNTNPQRLYLPVNIDPEYHYESVNVENQRANVSSLWWWTRRLLGVRQQYRAFAQGKIEFLQPENAKVLAYIRQHGDDVVLVIANLSRFTQMVDLDLSAYAGRVPQEVFGHATFPTLSKRPMPVTIGPHGFYWLALQRAETTFTDQPWSPARLEVPAEWNRPLFDALAEDVLPRYLPACRWFGGKAAGLREVRILQSHVLGLDPARMIVAEANFIEGTPHYYLLPLEIIQGEAADRFLREKPQAVVAVCPDGSAIVDAFYRSEFRTHLLRLFQETWKSRDLRVEVQQTVVVPTSGSQSRLLDCEQSNTSIIYADTWFLKFFRRFEPGPHPDVEVTRRLTQRGFASAPRFGGALHLTAGGAEGAAALLVSFTPNLGDAWTYTVDAVSRFFDRVLENPAADFTELVGGVYPERVKQLGQRTAEMHIALADDEPGGAFAPEPFSTLYQRGLYQAMRTSMGRVFRELKRSLPVLSTEDQAMARELMAKPSAILAHFSPLLSQKIDGQRIRIHGDFHLGQILNAGKDFVIVDFEGEPRRPLGERNIKRNSLRDVAGMLRSFDYVAAVALRRRTAADAATLAPAAARWVETIGQQYLDAYLEAVCGVTFLPSSPEVRHLLLRIFLLDKAVYEVGYELNYRPDWIGIPLRAALAICGTVKEPVEQV
jgi:maltose alpha-D-glucosyltransferase/alpha-amylase